MSKKTINNLDEMVVNTALRKSRATTRFNSVKTVTENARSVYLSSCQAIAERYAADGYKYAKSKQHLTKQDGDLAFSISFQSSHNNVSGEYVALWVHAGVRSKKLKEWRQTQKHPLTTEGYLAAGQIGNLLAKPSWYEWNLAIQAERAALIQDVISNTEEIVLPYFSNFEDVEALARKLQSGGLPFLNVGSAVEFLLCHDKRALAILHARWFLNTHSNIRPQYLKIVDEYRTSGIPNVQNLSVANQLAHVVVAYALPL